MVVVRNINDAKGQIQVLINNMSGMNKQIAAVVAATPEESRQELMNWVVNYMGTAIRTYVPALSGHSNVILPGANSNPGLAELRRDSESRFRFNPEAPEFVPNASIGGRRRKSMKNMHGGDDDENEPQTYLNQRPNQTNNNPVIPNTTTDPMNPNNNTTDPMNPLNGGRRRKSRRTARKHRKSRRANRK